MDREERGNKGGAGEGVECAMGSSPFFSVRVKQNEEHHDSYAVHALQELIIEQRAVCSQKLRPVFSSGLRCHQSCTGTLWCR